MSAATVLTQAMSGMPALSGTGGSLAALIRHIAPILGWSIEFDNSTDIIVIRPQSYGGGQALFYRIDDRAARGGAAPRAAEVRAYESMSDINTGARLVGPSYAQKSYYASTAAMRYYIIGDQYGFYFGGHSLRVNDAAALSPCYLGFLNRALPGDIPVCVMFGQPDSTAMSDMFYANTCAAASVSTLFLHRNKAGTTNIACAVINGGGLQFSGCGIGSPYDSAGATISLPAYPYYGEALLSQPFVNDGAKSTIAGFLPGLYAWHHGNAASVFPSLSHNDYSSVSPVTVDGHDFVTALMWNYGNAAKDSAAGVLFDVGNGFRP